MQKGTNIIKKIQWGLAISVVAGIIAFLVALPSFVSPSIHLIHQPIALSDIPGIKR